MEQLNISGTNIDIRPNGQLNNFNDWNIDVARGLAEREGIELKEAHMEIINVMRQYYQQYNISPIRKLLKREIAETLGGEKATDDYLWSLFPRDVLVQGINIAGIPTPLLDAEVEGSSHIQSTSKEQAKPIYTEFEYNGHTYPVYPRGNLVSLEDWDEGMAEFLAEREGLSLSTEHWQILDFLRNFYFKYGITPMVTLLQKHMRQVFGPEKCSRDYLYNLFPEGPSRQGSRIAGLPEPQGCIDP